MENNWKKYRISEVAEFKNKDRSPLKSLDRQKMQGIYPYYGASGIIDNINNFIFDGEFLLISEDGENLRTRKTPIAFKASGQFWVNNHAHILKEKEEGIIDYLEYYFSILDINAFITGAVQPKLSKVNLDKIEIPIPEKKDRLQINFILNSLTRKIELNRQMNKTLEQMAQTLFKSWFVDFDPVIDNALSAGNPIPEELQARAEKRKALGKDRKNLPEEIQKLFPDEFEYSDELEKWMPKGWRVESFASIAEVKYGKDHKKLEEGNIPVYGSGGIMRYVNQSLHTGESVLIPRKGTLSNLMYVNEEFWSVDTMFFTILKKEKHAKYLYYNLKLLDFNEMNVGSAVPSMTTKVLNSLDFILPQTNLVETFDDYIQNLYNKIEANNTQIKSLTNTRDTLLPKLISGEVRVPEIEKMID